MASIYSVQDGDWNTASTWGGGAVPTGSDYAYIQHAVTVEASFAADTIRIMAGGSLTVSDSWDQSSEIVGTFSKMTMNRVLHDTRRVNLDGVRFANVTPRITSIRMAGLNDGFPQTLNITNGEDGVIIDDPGFLSSSAILRDIKPEGCAPAYAEKVSNAVRYQTVTVHIKADSLRTLGSLYRMARGPFQVLLVTYSSVIKGHIESVVPDPASVGKEYITVKVTVTEGPGA